MQITDFKPAICAGCFAAKPDAVYVDFHADWDGPTFLDDAGQRQSIDDLIVCTDCVREAAEVAELHVNPIRSVELERDEARREAESWREYALSLEQTYGTRPQPIKRPPGRPRKTSPKPVAA